MPPSFFAIQLHDELAVLTLAWLPETPRRLLVGISPAFEEGSGVLLPRSAAADLLSSLKNLRAFRHEDATGVCLRAAPGNRGEPYRDGVDFSVDSPIQGTCFVEEDELARVMAFLSRGT